MGVIWDTVTTLVPVMEAPFCTLRLSTWSWFLSGSMWVEPWLRISFCCLNFWKSFRTGWSTGMLSVTSFFWRRRSSSSFLTSLIFRKMIYGGEIHNRVSTQRTSHTANITGRWGNSIEGIAISPSFLSSLLVVNLNGADHNTVTSDMCHCIDRVRIYTHTLS